MFVHTLSVRSSLPHLFEAIDAAGLLVQLHKRLPGGILDLQELARVSDTLPLLHGQAHQRPSSLGRDGVVAIAGSFAAALERALLLFDGVCGRLSFRFLTGRVGLGVVACLLGLEICFGRCIFRQVRRTGHHTLHDLSRAGIFEHAGVEGLILVPSVDRLIGHRLARCVVGLGALH